MKAILIGNLLFDRDPTMTSKPVLTALTITLLLAGALPASGAQTTAGPVMNEWEGMIACGVGAPGATWATCATLGVPGDEFSHAFSVRPGLKTLVVAMVWTPATVGTDQLRLHVDDTGSFHQAQGPSAIEFRLDAGTDFQEPAEAWDLHLRAFPPLEPAVVVQQPFTVHFHEFYGEHAPDGYSALPA